MIQRLLATVSRRSRSLASRTLLPFTGVHRMRRMSEEERFTFDLEGYLLLKQVLTAEEVAALRATALENCPVQTDEPIHGRVFGASSWSPRYQALIDHPRIIPYLVELIGPKFRLDHDYCVYMTTGGRDRDVMHGGATVNNPDHWYTYRDGVMRSGLTVVAYCLSAANDGDGGFCCVPGSHKSNLLSSLPADVRSFQRTPHYVRQPAVEAGDVIIFAEALLHGTAPWTADHPRLVAIYKYSPGHSAWMSTYYDLNNYTGLTEQQKKILAPPSVGDRPDSVDRD